MFSESVEYSLSFFYHIILLHSALIFDKAGNFLLVVIQISCQEIWTKRMSMLFKYIKISNKCFPMQMWINVYKRMPGNEKSPVIYFSKSIIIYTFVRIKYLLARDSEL